MLCPSSQTIEPNEAANMEEIGKVPVRKYVRGVCEQGYCLLHSVETTQKVEHYESSGSRVQEGR